MPEGVPAPDGFAPAFSINLLPQADVAATALAFLAPQFPVASGVATPPELWVEFAASCALRAAALAATAAAVVCAVACRPGCRRAAEKRRTRTLACAIAATALLTYFGGVLVLQTRAGLQRPALELRRVAEELDAAAQLVVGVPGNLLAAVRNIELALPGCPDIVQTKVGGVVQSFYGYRSNLFVDGVILDSASNSLRAAVSAADLLLARIVHLLCLPVALALVSCFALVYLALRSPREHQGGCLLRAVAALAFLAAPCITFASVAELGGALAVAAFCSDADAHASAVASRYPGELATAAAEYYIRGEGGSNPVLDALAYARAEEYAAVASFDFRLYDTTAMQFCIDPGPFRDIGPVTIASQRAFAELRRLLDLKTAYPLYHDLVHTAACGAGLHGLLGTALCHLAIGLLLLPRTVLLARRSRARLARPKATAGPLLAEMAEVV